MFLDSIYRSVIGSKPLIRKEKAPMTDHKNSIEERLNKHPDLKKRIHELLKVVEDAEGDIQKANDAEQMVIDELRKMGNEALQSWAKNKEKRETENTRSKKGKYKGNGKKK